MERSALFWPEGQRKSVGRRGSIMKAASIRSVRCAIYTRVSTEYGLDQEFNSLDAQYDAASAYIKSQAHAGWTLIRSRYDDGGYSGGSTDRPDLQRLLDDIAMAFQRTCRSRLASDLCRDAAHAGGIASADQQDRPQRRARHDADDAGRTLSPGACEDAPQSETT